MTICDRCKNKIKTIIIPIQLPDGRISYIELCPTCVSVALKLVFEELLETEEKLSEMYDCNLTRQEILNNILDNLKNRV